MEWKKIIYNRKILYVILAIFLLQLFIFVYTGNEAGSTIIPELQQEYVESYHDNIEKVIDRAEIMGNISIFAEADSFTNRNLERTAKDYKNLLNVRPVIFDYNFLEKFFSSTLLNWSMILCGILIAFSLIEENRSGLRGLIFSTRNGRGRLITEKMLTLFVLDGLLVLIGYGLTLCTSVVAFGGNLIECLGYPIQSVEMFKNLTIDVNIGGFLLIYLAYRWVVLFMVTLIVWMIMNCADNLIVSIGIVSAFVIVEYLLFKFIKSTHPLNVLRYCNIWYQVNGSVFFTEYRNLNIASYPINKSLVIGIWVGCMVLICIAVNMIVGINRYPCKSSKGILRKILLPIEKQISRLIGFIQEKLALTGAEFYKVLIMQKGILLIIILTVVFINRTDFTQVQRSAVQNMHYEFMDLHEGRPDEASAQYIQALDDELEQLEEEYSEAYKQYEAGLLTKDQWLGVSIRYTMFESDRIFQKMLHEQTNYIEQLEKERGIKAWYVNPYCYNHLLSEADALQNVLLVIGVALLCSGIFAYENKCGMTSLMHQTTKGRKGVFVRKLVVACVMTMMLYAVTLVLTISSTIKVFGMSGLGAPVQSLSKLSFIPFKISIAEFFVILYVLKGIILLVVAFFIFTFSAYVGQKASIMLTLILAVPSFLALAGLKIFRYISIIDLLSIVPFLMEVRNIIPIMAVSLFLVIIGAVSVRLSYKKWCLT